MKRVISLLCVCAFLAGGTLLAGCEEQDGPVERAGEAVDEAVKDTGRAVEDATD
jgi:predicted small secreted protein